MSIIEDAKNDLKRILPPPVDSFMREINIVKAELSRQRREMVKPRSREIYGQKYKIVRIGLNQPVTFLPPFHRERCPARAEESAIRSRSPAADPPVTS